jgi:hypothetical protein
VQRQKKYARLQTKPSYTGQKYWARYACTLKHIADIFFGRPLGKNPVRIIYILGNLPKIAGKACSFEKSLL